MINKRYERIFSGTQDYACSHQLQLQLGGGGRIEPCDERTGENGLSSHNNNTVFDKTNMPCNISYDKYLKFQFKLSRIRFFKGIKGLTILLILSGIPFSIDHFPVNSIKGVRV